MARVEGKVALVTGGASGIGRAAALLLAAEGAKVALSDVQDDKGASVAGEIEAAGGRALYFHHDVSDEAHWEEVVAALEGALGPLDILVNNAGVGSGLATVDEMTLEHWRQVMAVNLDGVFLGVKHGIRAMKRSGNGGSIINISLILGKVGMAQTGAYSASKGGVKLLTKTAALECARDRSNIRVNSIHPGFIRTPMVEGGIEKLGKAFEKAVLEMQPTREMGRPDDIAQGILHLASAASRFMTGSELVIDGGFTAR